MTETTSTAVPEIPPDPPPVGSPEASQDNHNLVRALWVLVVAVILAVVGFGVFYYLNQRIDSGPSQVDRVLVTAEKTVADKPNDIGARLALAGTYLKADRPDDALAQFKEILKAQPTNRSALLGSAGVYFDRGDMQTAKGQYSKVIESSGTGEFAGADVLLEEALYFRGVSELALKDAKSAVSDLEKAVSINSSDADAWNALGKANLEYRRPEKAALAFEQALLFVPGGWCDPYGGLSAAYQALKKNDGVTYATAMTAICGGDNSDVQAQALTSVAKGEFKVPALLGLGAIAEANGDNAKAADLYRQVIGADPKNIAAGTALSRVIATTASTPSAPTTPPASAS